MCKVDINITVLQREVLITLLLFARDNGKDSMLCHLTGGIITSHCSRKMSTDGWVGRGKGLDSSSKAHHMFLLDH